MVYFMFEPEHYLLTTASVERVRELWNCYHAYRYDVNCNFDRFLRENGIDAEDAEPNLSAFGYSASDVKICLN